MRKTRISGWKIAKVRGVDIKLHFSLVFLLFYVILVASAQFPFVLEQTELNPLDVTGSPLLWGVVFALGLFASIVIHEFAHVLVAQSMGVKVDGITLMMLGGVSEMEKIPEQPYAEFKVSVVGPLASFLVAGILYLIYLRSPTAELALFSYWLSRVNLVLGIFNLLPAFPLDGGRALRSFIAAKKGAVRATEISVGLARGLAWVLGFWGLIAFNFLLVLIALFIYSAATNELVISASRGLLRKVTANEALLRVQPVQEQQNLLTVVESMMKTHLRVLPVQTSEGLPAMISTEDIRPIPRDKWSEFKVKDVMQRVSKVLTLDEFLDESLPELEAYGALPVKKDSEIIGLVRYSDISEFLELKSLSEDERNRSVA